MITIYSFSSEASCFAEEGGHLGCEQASLFSRELLYSPNNEQSQDTDEEDFKPQQSRPRGNASQ